MAGWEQAIRTAQAEIDAAENGIPPPAAIAALHAAGDPRVMRVIAVLSACRAIVYPQLPPEGSGLGAAALRDLLARLDGGTAPMAQAEALLLKARGLPREAGAQQEALRCLGHAVGYLVSPSAQGLVTLLGALLAAQRDERPKPRATRQQMTGWMDEVVGRAPHIELGAALALAAGALEGAVPGLAEPYYFEAAGDDAHDIRVYAADARTRALTRPVMRIAEPRLAGRELQVRVKAEPRDAHDRFRIGYLFEHSVHRMFLDGCWAARCDSIAYACEATGEAWTMPA